MNKTKLIQIVAFASLAACTRIPSPSFEMTSPVMLDKTLKEVNLAQLISKPVPIGSRVALIPVANGNINPKDFYTIEENLTQQLIQGGYVVKQKPEAILLDSEGDFKSLPEFILLKAIHRSYTPIRKNFQNENL